MIAAALGALFFACAAILGSLLGNVVAEGIERFGDGPAPSTVPTAWLVGACAVIGAASAPRAVPVQLLSIAIVCCALVAIWCCDARTGIIPDIFTLAPLGVLIAVALWSHQWWIIASAFIPFLPFAAAAALSRGRGMGWGDVKLAALGGAVLGAQLSLIAFALACLGAVIVARWKPYAGKPIAFAPYLATAIAVAIPIGLLR
jgi:prepilin signal peptidase PulO-like enzyme (type II secretory pathway)